MTEAASLTSDVLENLRTRIGMPITGSHPRPYVTVATKDAIRHWCFGIGDYNPLYLGDESARSATDQVRLAPPSFLYTFDKRVTGGVMGLPGVTGMFAGVKWEWHRRITEGDEIVVASAVLHDVIEREGSFAGRQYQVIARIELATADGEPVATSYPYGFRLQRDQAVRKAKYADYQPHLYSEDELEQIWTLVEGEWRRGPEPLDAEKIRVGDLLGPIVRGPLTLSDFIVFLMGWGGQYVRSHGDWVQWARRHPGGTLRNAFGVPDTVEAVHWDKDLAQTVGVPGPYDYGPQRASWAITLVTNWMGDAATLTSLELELRKHVLVGDAIWITGVVNAIQAARDGVPPSISVDIRMRNQRDETVATGSAEVAL